MTPKDVWLKNITDSIKQIASAEFQEKGWIRNEIHDYCTFVETMCGLFDDSDFENFVDVKAAEWGFSDKQIMNFDILRRALNAYDEKYGCYQDPSFIVKDPEWLKIRELAKDALKSLGIVHYLDPSKDIPKSSLLNHIYWISKPEVLGQWSMKESQSRDSRFDELIDNMFRINKFEEVIAHYKDYEITENQFKPLYNFFKALKNFREKINKRLQFEKILEDPEWHHIQALAADVIKVFEYEP
jgi:hypothetical protein